MRKTHRKINRKQSICLGWISATTLSSLLLIMLFLSNCTGKNGINGIDGKDGSLQIHILKGYFDTTHIDNRPKQDTVIYPGLTNGSFIQFYYGASYPDGIHWQTLETYNWHSNADSIFFICPGIYALQYKIIMIF